MKTLRIIALVIISLAMGASNANAQNAKTKARLAEIRAAYAKAQQLADKGMKGPKKNYQVYESWTSDPNGNYHMKTEFFFDNSEVAEPLEVYPCTLVLARQTSGVFYQEFLYDKDGRLMFAFIRNDYGDGGLTERRYYYDNNGPIWMIDKKVDKNTKKVLKEKQEDISSEDHEFFGDAIYCGRPASELHQAFEAMNMIHD